VDSVEENHRPTFARTRLPVRIEEPAAAPLEPRIVTTDEVLEWSDST
jgi:hypothetical protein